MSILSRKTDTLYLIFFLIHIPVMFCTLLPSPTDQPLTNITPSPPNRRRPHTPLPSPLETRIHDLPPNLVHRNLPGSILRLPSRLV